MDNSQKGHSKARKYFNIFGTARSFLGNWVNIGKGSVFDQLQHDTLCAIWYHLYNLKNVKNANGGMLVFTKSKTLPWVFFTFFKSYK